MNQRNIDWTEIPYSTLSRHGCRWFDNIVNPQTSARQDSGESRPSESRQPTERSGARCATHPYPHPTARDDRKGPPRAPPTGWQQSKTVRNEPFPGRRVRQRERERDALAADLRRSRRAHRWTADQRIKAVTPPAEPCSAPPSAAGSSPRPHAVDRRSPRAPDRADVISPRASSPWSLAASAGRSSSACPGGVPGKGAAQRKSGSDTGTDVDGRPSDRARQPRPRRDACALTPLARRSAGTNVGHDTGVQRRDPAGRLVWGCTHRRKQEAAWLALVASTGRLGVSWRWRELNPRPPSPHQGFSGCSSLCLCLASPVSRASRCDRPSYCELSRRPP